MGWSALIVMRPLALVVPASTLVWLVAGAFFATGVSELLGSRRAGLIGFGWIAAGVAVLAWAWRIN